MQKDLLTSEIAPDSLTQTELSRTSCVELMSCVEDSPVRTSAMPASEQESKGSGLVFGSACGDSLASYDLDSSSWRTSQRCLDGGWELYSETWPSSGMTRSGKLYQLQTQVLPICESESGLWPTPRANKIGGYSSDDFSPTLEQAVKYATPQSRDFRTGQAARWDNPARSRNLNDQAVMMYPTPTAMDHIERRNEVGYLNIARCGTTKPGPHETDCAGTWANANYICAANPSTILALLSELEQAERERDAGAEENAHLFALNAQKQKLLDAFTDESVQDAIFDANNRTVKAEAALRTLRQASAWIPVSEKMPEFSGQWWDGNTRGQHSDNVLVLQGEVQHIADYAQLGDSDGVWATDEGKTLEAVTHWMPLPEAPKDLAAALEAEGG